MSPHGRVLVIGDDPRIAEAVRQELDGAGYAVDAAPWGQEALDVLAVRPCDVAILDPPPGSSGLDLLPAIRAGWPDSGVIVIAPSGPADHALPSLDQGVLARLEKPLDGRRLRETLERAMGRPAPAEPRSEGEMALSDLVERAPIGLSWVSEAGRILRANHAELAMLGYAPDEYVGRHVAEFLEDPAAIEDVLGRLRRGESLHEHEARLRARDGSIRSVLVSSVEQRRAGRLVYSCWFKRDITHRKRIEQVARALADVGHELAWTLDLPQASARIAQAVLGLFGVRRSFLYQRDQGDAIECVASAGEEGPEPWVGRTLGPGEGLASLAVSLGRPVWSADLYEDPRVVLPEWLARRLRGERLGAVAAVPLVDRGETLGALTLADAPGRQFTDAELSLLSAFATLAARTIRNARLYEEVRQTRDFLRSIAENSADAIVTTDTRGRLTYVSPGTSEMFGHLPEEILGRPVAPYYRHGRAEAARIARRLRTEGRIRSYETAIRTRDGRWVSVSASISLLRGADGAVVGTLGVLRDTSEREAMEAARREVAQLRMVTLLAGGVAHEVNNPLTAVIGHLELLAAGRISASDEGHRISRALDAARRIADIVARLRRITRIETRSDEALPWILDIERSSESDPA